MVLFVACTLQEVSLAQEKKVLSPYQEARKAVEAWEKAPGVERSLKGVYEKRWTLGMVYGQRFILEANQANDPDTITFSDFTDRRSFFGLEIAYLINNRLQVGVALDVLFLPKEQSISSIMIGGPNGIDIEGQGNGGGMLNLGVIGRYFLVNASATRPYLGVKVGQIRAIAEGGTGGFTFNRGQFQETQRLTETYPYGNLTLGFTHRLTLGFMIDLNAGYLHASTSSNLGGILSPGGVTTTLTLQIIVGAKSRRFYDNIVNSLI